MNELKNIIEKVNSIFLDEARYSIRMMEDLAMMEKYISESYDQRTIIELLQNADDAKSSCVKIVTFNNYFIFANNGRCFNEKDIVSISRSGASEKKQGLDIGYRGIGFKSIVSISNEILVYSNKTFFHFSKKCTSEALQVPQEKIPTIRVPFFKPEDQINDDIKELVRKLEEEGFSTIFIFLNCKMDLIHNELNNINNNIYLFLRNITQVIIDRNSKKVDICNINREMEANKKMVTISNEININDWLIISSKDSEIELAFKYENNDIVACDENESVYFCFLPTFEKTPYPFIINAPFFTDPSKKHLIYNNQNIEYIKKSARTVVNEIISVCNGKSKNYSIFNILGAQNNFSVYTDLFIKTFETLIKENDFLKINNKLISVTQYPILPEVFDNNEILIIKEFIFGDELPFKSKYLNDFEIFLKRYSKKDTSKFDLLDLLKNESFVSKVPDSLYYKMLSFIIRYFRTEWQLSKSNINFKDIIVLHSLNQIKMCNNNQIKELVENLKFSLGDNEINWFCEMCGFNNSLELSTDDSNSLTNNMNINNEQFLSKWRTAEQQCIEIEKLKGNEAKYVGSKNLGYDVESRDDKGNVRYIEVKLLSTKNGPFTMTNNEYSSAHLYGNNYYLCLICANENELEAIYIQNPVVSLKLEKRVKQWEWFCDSYNGNIFRSPIK